MQVTNSVLLPKLFIGLDVHKKSWSVSIRTDIAEHKTYVSPVGASLLYDYVNQHFKGYEVYVAYEAGCFGFSSAREFLNYAWHVTVVNPADIPKKDKQNYQKNDRNDSRNICKQLQGNQLEGIFIPTESQEQFRSLLRHRVSLSKSLRKIKSQIKGMLMYHGIALPLEFDNSIWSIAFKKWLKELKWSYATGAESMAAKLRTLDFIYGEYLQVANLLRAHSRKHHKEHYYLLMSIPGLGGYLASAVLAECGDILRFKNEREFSSYLGLIPGKYDTGNTEKNLGITPRANRILRAYLMEASWVAVRKDPEMQAYYRSCVGQDRKMVIVKVAHKLARRILSIIKTQKPYVINHNLNLDSTLILPPEAEMVINEMEEFETIENDIEENNITDHIT